LRYRLRTLMIVLAIGPMVVAFLYFGPVVAVWSGRFTLNIQLVNETGKTIDHVEAAVLSTRNYADMLVSHSDAEGGWMWKPVDLDANSIAQVEVRCSGRTGWLGHKMSYRHFTGLAMKIDFTDGSQSLFAADIPKWDGVRDMVVSVPNDD
jgi:hypothetical protein